MDQVTQYRDRAVEEAQRLTSDEVEQTRLIRFFLDGMSAGIDLSKKLHAEVYGGANDRI